MIPRRFLPNRATYRAHRAGRPDRVRALLMSHHYRLKARVAGLSVRPGSEATVNAYVAGDPLHVGRAGW